MIRLVSGGVAELMDYWADNGMPDPEQAPAFEPVLERWIARAEPLVRHAQSAMEGGVEGDFQFVKPDLQACAELFQSMSNGERFAVSLSLACREILSEDEDEDVTAALEDAASVIKALNERIEELQRQIANAPPAA